MKISELEEARPGSSSSNRVKKRGRRPKAATYKSHKPKVDLAPDANTDYGDVDWEDTTSVSSGRPRIPKQGKTKRKFGK